MLENGSNICSCKKKTCIRHGKCSECIEYHRKSKRLPYCKRPKFSLFNKLFGSKNYNNKYQSNLTKL